MKLALASPMKERTIPGFGRRLAQLRRSRAMTQAQLGAAAGVSHRVIVYYEKDGAQPPGAMLVDLARALGVTTDELLGAKPVRVQRSPKSARLLKRLQRVEELPATDQRAVMKYVGALLVARGRDGNGYHARPRD